MAEAFIFGTKSRPLTGMTHHTDSITVHEVDSDLIFEQTFKEHFGSLHAYAYTILKNDADAEEMVQNVFYKLWEKKGRIGELQSVLAYLYRAVHNECMNLIKHHKVKNTYQEHVVHQGDMEQQAHDSAEVKELEARIHATLQDLPEQCRTIFQMSRFEELKYREIADKLGLSVKTIENQMGKALKILRTKLADYITVLWLLFITFLN